MVEHFDVVVLGGGPGGYVAAIRAAQLGLSTAVVEEKYWGGVCLNVGCIPSKALLRNAELAHIFHADAELFGISGEVTFDYGAAWKRSRSVADRMVKGVHFLMKKNKIKEFNGWGTFTGPHAMRVSGNIDSVTEGDGATGGDAGTDGELTFDNCIIAAGATTRLLPGTQLSDRVVTYEEQIMTDNLPASMIIAGAGAIGVEFGYVMANYGVQVTIVEFLDRLVPLEDAEVSAELARAYKKLGIDFLTGTKVETIDDSGDRVKVTVSPSAGGPSQVLEADKVLQAIGFAPRTQGYGLENTGVKVTDRGAIDIDGSMRTSVQGLYAIGDCTAKLMLAHAAEAMGIVAAETIAGAHTIELDYAMIPKATYCQPQIGSFGYSEQAARDAGFDVRVAKFPFSANGKAHGLGDATGFAKLVADGKHGEILGAHLIGPDVTELLAELTLAQLWDLTAEEVSRNVHPHPTLSEALKEVAHGISGHMINL
jgi:dihydrolipoamide dehydrogenase